MPVQLLPTSAAAAAPAATAQPGKAAQEADFSVALCEAKSGAGIIVLPREVLAAPVVLKDAPLIKGDRGRISPAGDGKANRLGARDLALPQAAPLGAGSPVPTGATAPAARLDSRACLVAETKSEAQGISQSVRVTHAPALAASPPSQADSPAISADAAAGPAPEPHAASTSPDHGAVKPAAAAGVGGNLVPQTAPALAIMIGDALPDQAADAGAAGGTQDKAGPAIAATGPASPRLRPVAHDGIGPQTRGASPAADPGATTALPTLVQTAVARSEPQPVTAAAAAPAGAAPLTPGTQPQAAAATPPAAPPPAAAAQLGQAVAGLHVGAGSSGHVSIRLDPEALGGVRIDVRRGEDGTAAVTLTVERAQTLHALQTDLSHLHQALDRAGVPAEQRNVSLHLAVPEDGAGARDATAGGGGRSGQHGEPQQRMPSPTRSTAGGEQVGWKQGLPSTPAALLRAGFDITA